jgi:hypothetical protein
VYGAATLHSALRLLLRLWGFAGLGKVYIVVLQIFSGAALAGIFHEFYC